MGVSERRSFDEGNEESSVRSVGGARPGQRIAQRTVDLREAATEADEAFRIANLRYREGESELLRVLTIQQRVIGTKRSLATVQPLLLDQRVDLQFTLGGSWEG